MPFRRRFSKRKPTYRRKPMYKRKRAVTRKGSAKVKGDWEIKASAKRVSLFQKPMRIPTIAGQIPQRCVVRMGLDHVRISHAPAAIRGTEAFRLNSIYQPLISTTGASAAQPTLHDALSTLYQNYRVYGCKLKLYVRNTCTSPIVAGIGFTDINVSGTMTSSIIRRSATNSVILNRTSDNNDACVLEQYVPFKTVFPTKYNSHLALADFGSDPTDLLYGYLWTASTDGTTNVTAEVIVDMVFDVMVSSPDLDRAID